MGRNTTSSRKAKRKQFQISKYLKIKNMFGRFSPEGIAWATKMREDGLKMHEAHVNRVNDQIEDALQLKANSLKETWAKIGYNDSEIAMLEEAFFNLSIKNKDTYREDKKAARKLMKDASNSLKSRLNANS
jgi:hypothetical protein